MTPFPPLAQKQRARIEQAALLKAYKLRKSGQMPDRFESDFDQIFEVNPKNPVTQTGKTRY